MATAKNAAKKKTAKRNKGGKAGVTVRTYRHGLGDCHLLTLRGSDGSIRRMMIDCGLIMGTKDAAKRLVAVVEDIAADTDGKVDILVATHEHWDHISGFLEARALFEGDTRQVRFDAVWMGWLDDRSDPMARRIEDEKQKALGRLSAFVTGRRNAFASANPIPRTAPP